MVDVPAVGEEPLARLQADVVAATLGCRSAAPTRRRCSGPRWTPDQVGATSSRSSGWSGDPRVLSGAARWKARSTSAVARTPKSCRRARRGGTPSAGRAAASPGSASSPDDVGRQRSPWLERAGDGADRIHGRRSSGVASTAASLTTPTGRRSESRVTMRAGLRLLRPADRLGEREVVRHARGYGARARGPGGSGSRRRSARDTIAAVAPVHRNQREDERDHVVDESGGVPKHGSHAANGETSTSDRGDPAAPAGDDRAAVRVAGEPSTPRPAAPGRRRAAARARG